MISHLMGSRWGDEWSQPLEQFVAFHENMGGAVAPRGLEPVGQAAIRRRFEAFDGEWRAGHVSTQAFQPTAIACRDRHVCVQAQTAFTNTATGDRVGCAGTGLPLLYRIHPVA